MKKCFWLLPAFVMAGYSTARGSVAEFMPRLVGYSGNLTVESHYVSELKKTTGTSSARREKNSSSAFRETLETGAAGYVYHPDLFLFSILGSGLVDQLRNNDDGIKSGNDAASEEYDFRGYLLRRKPLHAEMYYNLEKPFLSGGYSDDPVQENTRGGVQLFYDKRPYHTTVEYFHNENKSLLLDRINDAYISRVNYSKGAFSGALAARHDIDNNITGLGTSKSKTNNVESNASWFKEKYDVISNISWTLIESDDEERERFYVSGRGGVELPWNFQLDNDLSTFHTKTSALTSSGRDSFHDVDKIDLELTQQLFRSLDSKFRAKFTDNRSDNGSFRTSDYEVSTNYKKMLRGGTIRAGLGTYIKRTQQQGSVAVGPELVTRKEKDPETYQLDRQDANIDTIKVEIKLADDSWQGLELGVGGNYTVLANPPQVVVGDLSSVVNKKVVAAGPFYQFKITYSTVPADFILQSNTGLANVGVDLFDGAVLGDFSHSLTSQEIVEGDPLSLEVSPTVTNDNFSIAYSKTPFTVELAYRITDSNFNEKEISYSATYHKGLTLLKPVRTVVNVHYSWAGLEFSASGEDVSSSESNFISRADNQFMIPRTRINLSQYMSFRRQRGNLTRTTINSIGFYSRNTGVNTNESDSWLTGGSFRTHVPRTKIPLSLSGSYEYETFVTGSDVVTIGYDVRTHYSWRFGGTSILLDGKYRSDSTNTKNGSRESTTTDDRFEFNVRMVRRLF